MAKRSSERGDPRRGEPTTHRNFRDEFEGSGDYGGSYTAGGAAGRGYGGGYAGYDEMRDEAPTAYPQYPRDDASLIGSRLSEGRGRRPDFTGRGPRGYRRSDIRINEDVSDALTQDPMVDASNIDVRVEAGEVTLSGTVESRLMKRRAEDVAEFVRGVRDIHNRLRIDPSAQSADRAADREIELEGGSSVDVMRPGGPAEAYTRAQGTEQGESDGS